MSLILLDVSQIKAIQIKKICYVWCDNQKKFKKLVGLDRGLTTSQLHTLKGYSVQEQFIRYHSLSLFNLLNYILLFFIQSNSLNLI